MLTRSITVNHAEARDVREILARRVRVQIAERRNWLLWRVFTVTGPPEAVEAAMQDVKARLDARWWEDQW